MLVLPVLTLEFLVPSLEIISENNKLSNDYSGATLIAFGACLPEFFILGVSAFQESGKCGGFFAPKMRCYKLIKRSEPRNLFIYL